MGIVFPADGDYPVLDLNLPVYSSSHLFRIVNTTRGGSMALSLANWDGDDLHLDFVRQEITDQDGNDRIDMLHPTDRALWRPDPLVVGNNDIYAQAVQYTSATSTKSPTVGASRLADSGYLWSAGGGAGAIVSSNNVYAQPEAILVSGYIGITRRLMATGYGFAVPAGNTILGIQANIERKADVPSAISDLAVELLRAGNPEPYSNKGLRELYYPTVDTVQSYGGPGDLWGSSWSVADINNANFGLALRSQNSTDAPTTGGTPTVDHMQMIVTYGGSLAAAAAYGATGLWSWVRVER